MPELSGGPFAVAVALGMGVLSALVPVVNAEAFLLAAVATLSSPGDCWVIVVALALGQTAGKIVYFLGARHAWDVRERNPLRRRRPRPPGPPSRWRRTLADLSERGLAMLERPLLAMGVILTSAGVGIPPLALTSVAAGLSRMPLVLFVLCTATGRAARFGALATPLVLAK